MTNIIIFGSCVARDTAAIMSDTAKVRRYVARQSMVSAAHGSAELDGEVQLDSAFQKRGVESDFKGEALKLLRASAPNANVLLLDLMDERLGVYRASSGSYITRTWELANSGILNQQPEPLTHIEFGSDAHFKLWQEAAKQIAEELTALDLPVLLLAPPLAERDLEGNALDYIGHPVAVWNKTFDRYYDAIEQFGITVLRPPADLAVADKNHKWGLAPFHYAEPMYKWFQTEIERVVATAQAATDVKQPEPAADSANAQGQSA